MANVLERIPVGEQDPKVRATNFEEVCLGYNEQEAMEEASRCINGKNAQCMKGCPVSINIPAFIEQVKLGNFEAAYHIINESSALPAVCGRVCPQESSVKANVSVVSRENLFPLVSWNVLWLIGQVSMASNRLLQRKRKIKR